MSVVDVLRNKDMTEYITGLERFTDGTLRKACPIHGGTNQSSFAVFDQKKAYCFSCGWSGDLIRYVMDTECLTFAQTIEKLCDDYGIDVTRDESYVRQMTLAEKHENWCQQYEKKLDVVYDYLTQKRGLTDEIIHKYRFGWSERQKALTIPMIDTYGRIANFGYRYFDSLPKYKNGKNNELMSKGSFLFNTINAQKHIKKNKRLFVVEGFFDAISAEQQGEAAVAYCGITFSKDHVLLIKEMTEHIKDGVQIILVPDNDGKAEKWVNRGRDLLQKHYQDANVRVAIFD